MLMKSIVNYLFTTLCWQENILELHHSPVLLPMVHAWVSFAVSSHLRTTHKDTHIRDTMGVRARWKKHTHLITVRDRGVPDCLSGVLVALPNSG